MDSKIKKHHTHFKVSATRTVIEMTKIVWHLLPLFINIALFLALAMTMYFFGGPVDTVDHAKVTFGETLYMSGVTGLTIGYGEIVPTTPVGRIAAVALAFLGAMMTGLITSAAVLASGRPRTSKRTQNDARASAPKAAADPLSTAMENAMSLNGKIVAVTSGFGSLGLATARVSRSSDEATSRMRCPRRSPMHAS